MKHGQKSPTGKQTSQHLKRLKKSGLGECSIDYDISHFRDLYLFQWNDGRSLEHFFFLMVKQGNLKISPVYLNQKGY